MKDEYYTIAMTTGYGKRIVFKDCQFSLRWFSPQEVIEDLEPIMDAAISDHCDKLELCDEKGEPVKDKGAQDIISGMSSIFNDIASDWFGAMRQLNTEEYEPYVKGIRHFITRLEDAMSRCAA